MKDTKLIHACFVDRDGLYYPLARKLSEAYKVVDYYDPNHEAFPTIGHVVVGDSYPDNPKLERIDEYTFWKRKPQYDLYVMPDSQDAGLQMELTAQGKKVWGSQRSGLIEHSRETFLEILKNLGFEIPPYERIIGLSKLREYLKPRENQIIKVSKIRGTMETKRWSDWGSDEAWLDVKAVELGGVKELQPFLVFKSIDTDIEIGADTYNVRSKYPEYLLDGTETKDRAYFSAVKTMADMPPQTQAFLEEYSAILGKNGHANFVSIEIRCKDEHFYPIDITPRGPLPGTSSQIEVYSNLAEIIAGGADGQLVDPELAGQFTAECVLTMDCKPHQWASVSVPNELEQWMKLGGVCMVNGRTWFPPISADKGNEIGWLVAIGDTPKETIEKLKGYVALLPDGVEARIEALAQTISEIESAKEDGIVLTDAPLPEPESVIEGGE